MRPQSSLYDRWPVERGTLPGTSGRVPLRSRCPRPNCARRGGAVARASGAVGWSPGRSTGAPCRERPAGYAPTLAMPEAQLRTSWRRCRAPLRRSWLISWPVDRGTLPGTSGRVCPCARDARGPAAHVVAALSRAPPARFGRPRERHNAGVRLTVIRSQGRSRPPLQARPDDQVRTHAAHEIAVQTALDP